MGKNKIIVINPVSLNIMKAICNSFLSNLVEIIILGNKEKIDKLCNKLNISINVFNIIHCNNEKEIVFKLHQYQEKQKINGIIIDDLKEYKYKELFKCEYLCHMIEFKEFKKSMFLLHSSNKVNLKISLNSIFSLFEILNIENIKIAIVGENKEKTSVIKENIKNNFNIDNIDIINLNLINKDNYNIIIFENRQLKESFINQINQYILPKIIEINKASNILIFDAKGKSLKNIFFEFLFFSKIKYLNNEFNPQTI